MGLFFNRNKDQNPKEDQYYIKNPDKSQELSKEELFGVSLGLIISEQNGAYVDSLEVGKTDFPQKQMMQRNWGIYDRNDAISFIESRMHGGHRQLFNRLLEIYIAQDCVDAVHIDFSGTEFEIKDNDTEVNTQDLDWQDVICHLENLDEVYELEDANAWFGDMEDDLKIGTDAWDLGRIVFVVRVCYSLGYITETEAWNYIGQIGDMARTKFINWDEYATSYVLGRAMWSGNDGEWETVAGFGGDALDAKESPWPKLNW